MIKSRSMLYLQDSITEVAVTCIWDRYIHSQISVLLKIYNVFCVLGITEHLLCSFLSTLSQHNDSLNFFAYYHAYLATFVFSFG